MNIPVLHLKDGLHHFSETIKGGSLHFYRDEIYPENIQVEIEVNKFEKNITCKITLSSRAHYQCDRCLRNFEKNYKDDFEILFHLGDKNFEINEESVIIISSEVKEIDLTLYIQEMLILAIPMKLLCDENCKGICCVCGADLNTEECQCTEKTVDPRWEKLISLRK